MPNPIVLVAIPAYNCELQIPRVIAGFDNNLLNRIDKIIVIDNGSTDQTIKAAEKAIQQIKTKKIVVWKNKNNYNLGGTHKVAFLTAEKMSADYVAILHGDDQAKTSELNNLLDSAINVPNAGAILGTRFMKGSKLIGYDRKRIWGNKIINIIYTLITFRVTRDLGSGLNLFRVKDLSDHRYLGFGDTITFNIDLLLDYYSKKTKLVYVPITWREDDQVSNARNFKVGKTALKKVFLWRLGISQSNDRKPSDYISEKVK